MEDTLEDTMEDTKEDTMEDPVSVRSVLAEREKLRKSKKEVPGNPAMWKILEEANKQKENGRRQVRQAIRKKLRSSAYEDIWETPWPVKSVGLGRAGGWFRTEQTGYWVCKGRIEELVRWWRDDQLEALVEGRPPWSGGKGLESLID